MELIQPTTLSSKGKRDGWPLIKPETHQSLVQSPETSDSEAQSIFKSIFELIK